MNELAKREGFFDELLDFRRSMDELFQRMFQRTPLAAWKGLAAVEVPPVETWVDKDGKTYHARIALPGVEPQDVQVNVQNNTLSVCAERKETKEAKEANYYRREFTYGSLERTIALPDGVEADKITAELNNGVLEITAPIAAAAAPRRIEIKAGGKSRATAA